MAELTTSTRCNAFPAGSKFRRSQTEDQSRTVSTLLPAATQDVG